VSAVIYPNPSNGKFTIEVVSESSQVLSFRLTDLQGRTAAELPGRWFPSGSNQITFDVSGTIPEGVYILEVNSDKGSVWKKVVILN
jgi:hypothetical protein